MSVCAVVVADGGGELQATIDGLEAQTRPPEELLLADDLGEAVRVAIGQRTDWVWALDASVAPEPPALEQLMSPLTDLGPLPAPALLASRILTPEGSLDHASLPFARVRDPDQVVAGYERRLLEIRLARRGSLLVSRTAVERRGLPRARRRLLREDLEWTARLLRHELGLLVPRSVAVRRSPAANGRAAALREAGSLLELSCSGGLSLRERPWFALRAAEAGRS